MRKLSLAVRRFCFPCLFLSLTIFCGSEVTADECSDLKAVAQLASQDFQPMADKAVSADRWSSKMTIAGWSECSIVRGKTGGFECTSRAFKSRSEARKYLEARIKPVKDCLGPGWERTDFADMPGLLNFRENYAVAFHVFPPDMGIVMQNQEYTANFRVYSMNTARDKSSDAASTATGPQVIPEQFCPDLKKVIEAASKKFDEILGKRIGSSKSRWVAKVQLQDWYDCKVSELNSGSRYYYCELPPYNKVDGANALFDKLEKSVGACLGSEWLPRKRVSDGLRRTAFERGNGDPTILVKITKDDDEGTWAVKLDVDAD